MSTFVIILIILIIVIIDIATVRGGKMNYPLLKNRSSDIKSWRFDDIDVTITAAYLEVIAGAFFLEDVFKLQPTDSLKNLTLNRTRSSGEYRAIKHWIIAFCGIQNLHIINPQTYIILDIGQVLQRHIQSHIASLTISAGIGITPAT